MRQIFLKALKKSWAKLLMANALWAICGLADSYLPQLTKILVYCDSKDLLHNSVILVLCGLVIWWTYYKYAIIESVIKCDIVFEGRKILYAKLEKCKNLPDQRTLLAFVQTDSGSLLNYTTEVYFAYLKFVIDLLTGAAAVWYFLSTRYVMILFISSSIVLASMIASKIVMKKLATEYDAQVSKFYKAVAGFGLLFKEYLMNGNSEFARGKIAKLSRETLDKRVKRNRIKFKIDGLRSALQSISTLIAVILTRLLTPVNLYSPVDVLIMTTYYYYIFSPLAVLMSVEIQKLELAATEKRVNSILESDELTDEENKMSLDSIDSIEFKNVKLEVKTKSNDFVNILDGINLKINAGEKIGIIGPSGAGKSTLIKMLYKELEASSGVITINGVDINKYNRESIFKNIFVVQQESRALEGTIKENLQVARADATDDQMIEALRKSGLGHLNLDEKVEGDDSRALSGGEKQRLAIARMFLRPEAKIIILDEATSALDEQTQTDVLRAVNEYQKEGNRIVISIAHRLSTIKNADKICVLSDGVFIEQGSHEELMELRGRYYSLTKASERV